MATGRAVVLDRPLGSFSIREFPVPRPEPGTVLLRMALSGCCATDAHTYLGQWQAAVFPVLLGHENVGRVVATGAGGARDFLGRELEPGDLVFARWAGVASATSAERSSNRAAAAIARSVTAACRSRSAADSPSTYI